LYVCRDDWRYNCGCRLRYRFRSGLGAGNRGSYEFIGISSKANKEDQNEDKREDKTKPPNKVLQDLQEPLTNPKQHGFAALKFWIRFKEQLKTELPIEEWNLWVRPAYLFRESDGHLLLALPVSRKITDAYLERQAWLREKLQPHGYSCSATKYPDDYTLERVMREYPEQFEKLTPALKKRAQSVAS
jgi:hypothetical protein